MEHKKCIGCGEEKRCRDSRISWVFFAIGLLATFSLRVVTILIYVGEVYARIAWYVGVGGFFLFFLYKFRINNERSELIRRKALVAKLRGRKSLNDDEYMLLGAILCAVVSKKERIIYFFIFFLSAVAILFALYLDFFAA